MGLKKLSVLTRLHFLLSSSLLLFPLFSYPQETDEFRVENITSEYVRIDNGLSQNSVLAIHLDKDGFLWAGTWNGLNRFDGYQFRVLTNDVYQPAMGLTRPTIVGISEDTLGNIWAATSKGLNKIRKSDLTVTQFTQANSANLGMVSDSLTTLFGDSRGKLWIGTNQGVLILDPGTSRFTHMEFNPRDNRTISSNIINCFEEDTAGNIWVGTAFGLSRIINRTGQIIRHLDNQNIKSLESDGKGNLWIGSDDKLIKYSAITRNFEHINYSSKPFLINTIYYFREKLWIGTQSGGAFLFDPNTNESMNLREIIQGAGFQKYITILDITSDKNGLLWMGTSHNGLVKLIPDPYAFTTLAQGHSIYGVIEIKSNVFWLGSQEGALEVNRNNMTTRLVHTETMTPYPISDNQINNIIKDEDFVWICTQNGLNRLNLMTGKNQIFKTNNTGNSIAGNFVWDVIKDHSGKYWIATQSGISQWDPETGQFVNFRHNPDIPNSLSNNFCLDILEESPGILLISTQYGLNRFNTLTETWTTFLPVEGDLTSISSEYIFGSFKDSQGDIWIYTNGGGVARFDAETQTFLNYGTFEGISDNLVYGMAEDNDAVLWLITNNGLCRFDPYLERFANFDVNDGLLSNEFNINGILKRDNGEMIVCGVNGSLSFFPHKAWRSSEPPLMNITRFQVHLDNTTIDVAIQDTILIKSTENTFSIDFSCMDFHAPFKNQYQYQLVGYDTDWTKLSVGAHQAEYRKIKPGHYTFLVKGTNSFGLTGPPTETIIHVVPAWYQTLLFQVTASLLAFALIAFLILLRLIHLRNRHEMEKQLLTTQTELIKSQKFALRSQMNPHFIFNSLNSIQNFVLKNDVDSANYYLSNFSSLMRKVLEFSQYNYITLAEEFELITLYLKMEKLRFSKKFEIQISIDPSIDQHLVKIPPMLLQPYLENAILHGLQLIKHKGLLKVEVTDRQDHMLITIEDNGIGRERAQAIRERTGHKSKGLANIEKRIQLYNKISIRKLTVSIEDLKDAENNPAGTLVKMIVPYEMEEQIELT